MIEIKFYGRGGQGAVVASSILANAAFKEGRFVQAFPFYGIERRGAPVAAYTRIDARPIRQRGQVRTPSVAIVLDPYFLEVVDVTQGLKPGAIIVLNTGKPSKDFDFSNQFKVFTCDATAIAVKYSLGTKTQPIVNTAILGAFSKATGLVRLESIIEAVSEKVTSKIEDNLNAIKEAYDEVKGEM
jgi:pyruvate ferredoxin oxidoreductase gamma subunit/2-oxoisovalerate ferredoxin oxidoreductase gamma subunit